MASLRLVLTVSALLVLALCWSVVAKPTESTPLRGVVTKYITPMANLSLDKLVGRWYIAEGEPIDFSSLPTDEQKNISARICLAVDFHYNDNGTLVDESFPIVDGVPRPAAAMLPVRENGVWDAVCSPFRKGKVVNNPKIGLNTIVKFSEMSHIGEVVGDTSSHAVVYVDERFLAVATCNNTNVKDCEAYTLVRHVADADSQSELADLHRRLVSAGVDNVDRLVKIIEPCRSISTAVPDLSAQGGPSTPSTV